MKYRTHQSLTCLLGIILLIVSGCQSAQENPKKPNVVFIFADDMGYGDVSALNPSGRIQTPAIDELVANGITFSEAHASASVCTPSRYGLLTGRYAFCNPEAAGGISGFEGPVIEKGRDLTITPACLT